MKRFLLGAAALVALAAPAAAADLAARPYTKAPAAPTVPATIYNWTGFYIGGHIGGAFAGNNSLEGNGGRFLGGVQGGFDYQFAPNWVTGIEAEYSWMTRNNNGVTFPGGVVVTDRQDQLGSVTGRFGYTWGPGLLYAKGGYAFRGNGNNVGVTVGGVPAAFATTGHHNDGWTVGTGLEYQHQNILDRQRNCSQFELLVDRNRQAQLLKQEELFGWGLLHRRPFFFGYLA